jgi:hypothetical protein
MNYELIKQLKDNGFPFQGYIASIHGTDRFNSDLETEEDYLATPTLEELIGACPVEYKGGLLSITSWGNTFGAKGTWMASYRVSNQYEPDSDLIREDGSSPSEAVAKLWLALNK